MKHRCYNLESQVEWNKVLATLRWALDTRRYEALHGLEAAEWDKAHNFPNRLSRDLTMALRGCEGAFKQYAVLKTLLDFLNRKPIKADAAEMDRLYAFYQQYSDKKIKAPVATPTKMTLQRLPHKKDKT